MLAVAMIALLLAVEPAQEVIENLENQTVKILLDDESMSEESSEEVVINEECEEYTDEIVFGDENEVSSEDLTSSEEI